MVENDKNSIQQQTNNLQIELLKRDIQLIEKLTHKIAESLEKSQEINISLGKIISVHEQKHKQIEGEHHEVKQDLKEMDEKIENIRKEITGHINKVEERISNKIDSLKEELNDSKKDKGDNLSDFLKDTNKFTYMAWGAVIVLSWVLSNVNLTNLAALFK